MKIVVTGATGFIGFHIVRRLIEMGHNVTGIDNLTPSYGSKMAEVRYLELQEHYGFRVEKHNLLEMPLEKLIEKIDGCDAVLHLAAWPGVRLSKVHPYEYSRNNIETFNKMIEAVRVASIPKFLYASSSSVYANLGAVGPVKEDDADGKNLLSYYAATKWINERTASQYRINFGLNSTALRFFTVYGPYGRPDMAYWQFTNKLLNNEMISLHGSHGGRRCFTFIEDVTSILTSLIPQECNLSQIESLNISDGEPRDTLELLNYLAFHLGISNASYQEIERPKDDAISTWADTSKLKSLIGDIPKTSLELGTKEFVRWFQSDNYWRFN
jgi:UDP-glucuronate 4-epimerase